MDVADGLFPWTANQLWAHTATVRNVFQSLQALGGIEPAEEITLPGEVNSDYTEYMLARNVASSDDGTFEQVPGDLVPPDAPSNDEVGEDLAGPALMIGQGVVPTAQAQNDIGHSGTYCQQYYLPESAGVSQLAAYFVQWFEKRMADVRQMFEVGSPCHSAMIIAGKLGVHSLPDLTAEAARQLVCAQLPNSTHHLGPMVGGHN